MDDDIDSGTSASTVARAEDTALRNGLPGFSAWLSDLERRHTVMPHWYWDELACRRNYVSHIRASIDWQERERRINAGATKLHETLTQHF